MYLRPWWPVPTHFMAALERDVDHLILFSSIAGMMGNPGQAITRLPIASWKGLQARVEVRD